MENTRFTTEYLSAFCLGLGHLLQAGLTTGDGLDVLARDSGQSLLRELARRADEGLPLSENLARAGFPDYVCTMTAAGERTGRTEEALLSLAEHYENRARLEARLRDTLLQPLILLAMLAVVMVVLLGWVLPVFDDVYRQLGASLTGVAGVLLAMGRGIRAAAPVLLPLMALACAGGFWLFCTQKGQQRLFAGLSRRGMFPQADAARLTQLLSMALNSGLGEEQAMTLAVGLGAEGAPFRKNCEACLTLLAEGAPLPRALEQADLLPAADCRLLEAGYRSGCADTVMTRLALRIGERSEAAAARRLERIEPALVLTAALLVGLVLLSVLLPLTAIMAAIG